MKIAIDAMGGGYAPSEVVAGAIAAARETKTPLILVGAKDAIQKELASYQIADLSLELVGADEVVEMDESPVAVLVHAPENRPDAGSDFYVFYIVSDYLPADVRSLIELDYCNSIGDVPLKSLWGCSDYGVCYYLALTGEAQLFDLSLSPALRAKAPWREESTSAARALRANQPVL